MNEEPIRLTVTKHSSYVLTTTEAFADALLLSALVNDALDMSKPPAPQPPDPGPHPRWLALREAADAESPWLAELVELHEPKATVYTHSISWACCGEPPSGYEWDYADWPCETTVIIAKHLGVEIDEPESQDQSHNAGERGQSPDTAEGT